MSRHNKPIGEWRMRWVSVEVTEADVDVSVWPFDECLIRKTVTDQAPNALAHLRKRTRQPLRLFDIGAVRNLTAWQGDAVRRV